MLRPGASGGCRRTDRRRRPTGTGTVRHTVPQCAVPAQVFAMGDAQGDGNWGDGEVPVHEVAVAAYSIDATSVTNADFARFVADTGFRTEAETFGFSAVFHLAVAAPREAVMGPAEGTPWWFGIYGADWQHPGGSDSDLTGLDDHPVVHVSWNDAAGLLRVGRTRAAHRGPVGVRLARRTGGPAVPLGRRTGEP